MAEESVGTIIDSENKILTPVYIYTDSNSSTLPTTLTSSKAGFGIAGGMYNSTFYGITVNPEGKLSTITWNRTSDPVIGNTDLVVVNPGTGQNPLASGFNISFSTATSTTTYNILYIDEVGEITSGDWNTFSILLGLIDTSSSSDNYSRCLFQINNNTSKNLKINYSLEENDTSTSSNLENITNTVEINSKGSSQTVIGSTVTTPNYGPRSFKYNITLNILILS